MLPSCNSHPMLMPANSCMPSVPHVMVPMMSMQSVPVLCPPNQINMCLSTTTTTNAYDSRMYGRFRHVGRDQPTYRHAPFDWYRPPKQRYDVVHEDTAVVTLNGPMPIGDFYRYYIYGDDRDYHDDDNDDSSSYASEEYDDTQEPFYAPRRSRYRPPIRSAPDYSDDEERSPAQPSTRANNYSTLDPTRRNTMPSSSSSSAAAAAGYQRNRSTTAAGDNDFDDTASVNSTYGN